MIGGKKGSATIENQENHLKITTIIDTGTHKVDVIEDGTNPECNWAAIYKLFPHGDVMSVMRVHGKDAEPYVRMAASMDPKLDGKDELIEKLSRDYQYNTRKYAHYIKSGLNMKAEYFRGRCDSLIECIKRIDPETAGVLEERKLNEYFD